MYQKEMSLREWQKMFAAIYPNWKKEPAVIFTHLVKVFGAGSQHLFRRFNEADAHIYVAKIFAWYCALANKLDIDIDSIIWAKYPAICPRCLSTVCECTEPIKSFDIERITELSRSNVKLQPRTLREWQAMFAHLYRSPNGGVDIPPSRERIALLFARIAEELGELAEALLEDTSVVKEARAQVLNEMADLGAWIFSLGNNIQHIAPGGNGIQLADIVWEIFQGKCDLCQEPKCLCPPGSTRKKYAESGVMSDAQWDDLTGLGNAKAFKHAISRSQKDYGPGKLEWSLIRLDIDKFKKVNDTYGHKAGDSVLQHFAECIKNSITRKGFAYRCGGDEFAIILESGRTSALATAETVRRRLESTSAKVLPHRHDQNKQIEIYVTASIGVASSPGDGSPQDLDAVADSNAYKSKELGGNNVYPAPDADVMSGLRLK